jgi:HSP20 family protein
MERDLEDVSDTFLSALDPRSSLSDLFSPALDVMDCGNEVVLRADLPGLQQSDIELEVQDGTLTLRGERKDEHEEHNDNYYCVERWEGAFSRSIRIPPGVDPNKIRAEFNNGVLEVHMPKKPEAAPKKIEIKADDKNSAGTSGARQNTSGETTQRNAPASGGASQPR